jgi:hypothetical protein
MNRFVLKSTFIKIYIYHFVSNLFENVLSKLWFVDCVVVQNDLNYQYGGSMCDFVLWLPYVIMFEYVSILFENALSNSIGFKFRIYANQPNFAIKVLMKCGKTKEKIINGLDRCPLQLN